MNYEEKLREIINSKYYHSEDKAVFAKYFPELKENEDERMRKEIINFLRLPHRQFVGKRDHEKWISWLEKQKDYIKPPNSTYTSNKDVIEFADKYSHDVWEKLMDNFKKIENYSIGCNDVSDIVLNAIINTYNWLEKQGDNKECDEEWEVSTGLYKCTKRMFDGTPEGRLLFEVGNLYKCISKNDIAEFESSYGHSVFLIDPVVRNHFIKV